MKSFSKDIVSITEEDFISKIDNQQFTLLHELIHMGAIVYSAKNEKLFFVCYNGNYFKMKAKNEEDLIKNIDECIVPVSTKKNYEVKEFLYGLNPYGDLFPTVTTKLIKDITSILNTKEKSTGKLDRKLLLEVDNKILHLQNGLGFKKKYVLNLIALIGEVFIAENKGAKWEMDLSSFDNETWNPNVVLDNGKKIVLIAHINDKLINHFEEQSISMEQLLNSLEFISQQPL